MMAAGSYDHEDKHAKYGKSKCSNHVYLLYIKTTLRISFFYIISHCKKLSMIWMISSFLVIE